MVLIELNSSDALGNFIKDNTNGGDGCGVIICFSAHWCGPCKQSKPALEEFFRKQAETTPNSIQCGYVYESNIGSDITKYNIKGFPTYVFFGKDGIEKDRVVGVNFNGISTMISKYYNPNESKFDTTKGNTLGGGSFADKTQGTPEEQAKAARAARLARLGGGGGGADTTTTKMDTTTDATTTTTTTEPMEIDDDDKKPEAQVDSKKEEAEEAKNDEDDQKAATDAVEKEEKDNEEMIDPTTELNQDAVTTLTEGMGFLLIRAQKGLLFGHTKNNVESAVEWITDHQDDVDIDDPIEKVKKKKPLTPEEKLAKIEKYKQLLKDKRNQRVEEEKVDQTEREKQRRFMGKEMAKTKEQLEKEQRKREGQKRKAEKIAYKKERERIRQELAKDKAERLANKGKLTSRIGVEGYKPDGIQYDVKQESTDNDDGAKDGAVDTTSEKKPKKLDVEARLKKIDEFISKVSSYRAGGDGGKCLKVLKAYIGNVASDPNNQKFKTINTDNKAYKTKVKPLVGAKNIFLMCGFQKEGTSLVLSEENTNAELLSQAKSKLEAALTEYNK